MARLCSVMGCETTHYCKGYCRLHYSRWKAHGTPDGGDRNHAAPEVKFWRYVERKGPQECWPWKGMLQKNGYGRMGVDQHSKVLAHRLSHKIATGEEPEAVMHSCDNRWCVNPAHLRSGTYAENNADMRAKGRDNRVDRTRGAAHHRSKLTEADVRLIKSRPDEKPGKLAAEFGVKSAVVQRIRNGTAWKHVT